MTHFVAQKKTFGRGRPFSGRLFALGAPVVSAAFMENLGSITANRLAGMPLNSGINEGATL